MITTLAELLQAFVKANVEILNDQDLTHPTSVGDMFEGLSKEVIHKSIFAELNLKVVKNSFIVGCKNEFDVLLVEGEGKQYPFTDRFQYAPEQVVAIIQVKKNFHAADLRDSFESLQFIISHYENVEPQKYMGRFFRDSFRNICRKDVDAYAKKELTESEEWMWHTLRLETLLPPRIVWGFNGYKSEKNFRDSLFDFLTDNLSTEANRIPGFGPHNFPSLIICEKFSMMKQNGMPFICPIEKDGWWPFYTSSSYNPLYYLLEIIWTRLSYKYELSSDIFGEDLTMEPATRFIDCRIKEANGKYGWEYNYFAASEETLASNTDAESWSPAFIDNKQFSVINELGKSGEIDLLNHNKLDEFVMEGGFYTSLEDFIEKFKATGLVYVQGNKLRLLTDACQCVFLPSGQAVAGDNKTGRLSRWVMNEMKKYKEEKLKKNQ